MSTSASILICTRNRAPHLRATLQAMSKTEIPQTLDVELLVVDNGSTDETSRVVEECKAALAEIGVELRYLNEPQAGVAFARNAALQGARGDVLVFADDDVRPDAGWLAGMSTPLLCGQADVVAGGVRLASYLEREWMTPTHRGYFACSAHLSGTPGALVCANMALSRRVLEKVPAFDTELGSGRLGFAEDTLFAFQLIEAGFRLHGAWDVFVEHHFEPSRLERASLEKRAIQQGRSMAYVWHHWLHAGQSATRARLALRRAQLALLQLKNGAKDRALEGCSLREAELLENIGFCRQYLIEAKRPRNYARRGLVKLTG